MEQTELGKAKQYVKEPLKELVEKVNAEQPKRNGRKVQFGFTKRYR
jgi:hypothetical protein